MPQAGEQQSQNAGQPWYRIHFPRVRGPSQSNSKFAGASRGFCLCPPHRLTPSHPPLERLSLSLHPAPRRSAETLAGVSPGATAEATVPATAACCARFPRPPLPPLSPLLKGANPKPIAATGASLRGQTNPPRQARELESAPGWRTAPYRRAGARYRPRPGPPRPRL
jgi:hypothetical protein